MSMTAPRFAARQCVIPAQLSRVAEARDFAESAAADFGFDDGRRYEIKTATSEAVANAIEHGSAREEDAVLLRAVDEDGILAIYIGDGGQFRPPPSPPEALSERGRGLAVINGLVDEIDLRTGHRGTVLRFAKRLD